MTKDKAFEIFWKSYPKGFKIGKLAAKRKEKP